jgi:hypothetical protein
MNAAILAHAATARLSTGPRVVIMGGPRVGKTHLANRLGGEHGMAYHSTDELIGKMAWSDVSAEVVRWFEDMDGPYVVEGVASVRAVRKWCAAHPEGLPADFFLWLSIPRVERTKGQVAMGKGCASIWTEVEPELRKRGARIFTDTQGEL